MKLLVPLAIIACLLNSSLQSMHTQQVPVLSLQQKSKLKSVMIQQATLNAAQNLHRELMSRPQPYQNADRLSVTMHHNNTMVQVTLSLISDQREILETTRYMSSEDFHAIINDQVKSDSCCC